jgi:hypothetical protein
MASLAITQYSLVLWMSHTTDGNWPVFQFFYLCYDRRSVSQSVLVSSTHLGHKTRILLLSGSCELVDVGRPSLTKERVCRLKLLLDLASAVILGSESRGTRDNILLSQI